MQEKSPYEESAANMSRKVILWMFAVLVFVAGVLAGQSLVAQTAYDLPNVNTGCPASCRQISWKAGSDLWNGGTLPNYTSVTCSGLAGNGTTDDGPAIQSCINAASPGTAVFVPAGTYLINSKVRLKSNVVLRGAKPSGTPFLPTADASATTFNLGSNGQLTTQNFSFSNSSNLNPPTSYANNVPGFALSGAPKKGDTTLTVSSGSPSAGSWISVFADNDPSLVNSNGSDGLCQWCGDATGYRVMQQIVPVTSVSGSTLTLGRPLYYTLYNHPEYRIYNFPTQKAGFENFRANATGDIGSSQIILLQGCLYCWVKGVETYDTGSSSGSAHIETDFSYGAEIRDNYVHSGRSSASGANYGIYFQFINSDHKVENNIMRNNRHSLIWQGGGSGIVALYNYIDDDYTDDLTYLGSARTAHGAHPYMNLLEGNVVSHITADNYWGTSSHFVFFRNWIWGDETGTGVPRFPPSSGYDAVDVWDLNSYYSFVGNVLGMTGKHTTWSAATLRSSCSVGSCGYDSPNAPSVYSYGLASSGIPSPGTTSINNGNWDYKTQGVAYWEGGSTNNTLRKSMYYSSAPNFFSGYTWPPFGPEGNPTINTIPAQARFAGTGMTGTGPAAPTNLAASVQ